ncbi:chemotaxis protein CheA [Maritimibacter sp. 55A14]|uniref:chemotaxis protein CheA n=1 Tax=Maritimibacter sp. 55A14 TaxID=2174844 RepID=UPI000D6213C1|nr:chemotaxis protein CheA [Maritimibacter sp. 55A14]PWE30556.1 chemotaxis protein CheA [Maritimibacter sp. 55A14]
MNDLNDMFFQECDDLLEGLSSGLDDLENGSGDEETVNSMFRAVHSIKGGAGAFGLDQLVGFAHAMENVLDDVRAGRLTADENIVALLFTASDHLSDLVDAARNGSDVPQGQGASILSDLKLASGVTDGDPATEAAGAKEELPAFEPLTLTVDGALPELDELLSPAAPEVTVITFRATPQLYANGHDPALLFRGLEDLGNLTVEADLSSIVPLRDAPWSTPSPSWKIRIVPDDSVDEAAIRDVFEFVDGLCELEISAETAPPDNAVAALVDGAPEAEGPSPSAGPGQGVLTVVDPAAGTRKTQAARSSTIRVDLQRVDRLINLVGELVIAEAMLRQSMDELPHSANGRVDEAMNQFKQLSGAIQESVMAIRAQPVRSLFQRMSRIVRETSREAGKSARLVTIGDATEVDKTVTERLVEPLTHMIRNAIDHGLEVPEKRRAAGKDERGTVTLEAAHRSGRVVITLRDDGAGIDRARVRQIAEEKGMIRLEDDLTDPDIDNLLFRPGFSTASEVSNLSGRGVGMDVVRNEIQALGGRVSLQSEPGNGTSVTISLPLTLAVLEGMLVRVADQSLIVPTLPLREMLQPGQARIHTLCDGDRVLALDNELVPITDLGAALGYRDGAGCIEQQSLLLIEGDSGRRSALTVDAIAEQREVVIKGLEQNYQSIPGIAAATILGDGKIALIVDTDQMIALPVKSGAADRPAPNVTGDAFHA